MAAWISQLRKGLVDLCILLAVGHDEHYGYSLVQMLRGVPNLEFTESTIYPALARLIEDGLIHTDERPSPVGPARRYLSLSSAGRRRLQEMREHWAGMCQSVESLLNMHERG